MLFHLKITVENEAKVADASRKLNPGMAERNCCGSCNLVLREEEGAKRIASV